MPAIKMSPAEELSEEFYASSVELEPDDTFAGFLLIAGSSETWGHEGALRNEAVLYAVGTCVDQRTPPDPATCNSMRQLEPSIDRLALNISRISNKAVRNAVVLELIRKLTPLCDISDIQDHAGY